MSSLRTGLWVLSCVGGGPMERLVTEARRLGLDAEVVSELAPARWRGLMASGRTGRLRARLAAMVRFPGRAVARVSGSPWGTVAVPTTNPFFLPFVMVATRAIHGRRVVPLVYDLYPDALEAGGVVSGHGVVARLARVMNRFWFSRADGVVFIGKKMAEHARSMYGEPRSWTVLETGARAAELSDVALGSSKPESDLERWCQGKTILAYVGNMGHVHDWETLISVIPGVLGAQPPKARVGVVIAATGPGAARLREAFSGLPSHSVRFEGPLDDRGWARLLKRTDVSLVTLKSSAHRTSIPSKTFSAMAAGSAVLAIAPTDSDLADLVTTHQCGRVVAPGDVASATKVLLDWLGDSEALASAKQRGRQALLDHYDMPVLAERWQAFLEQLPATGSTGGGAKRALDIVASGLGLVVAGPMLLTAAAAIRLTMGAPVLFRQERPGLFGEPFMLLKFRTMRDPRPGEEGPDSDGARITRVGAFLRKTSLDELPTLLNVFRGDMSLVGPRPLLMRYLARYTPRQARRHEVLPGVTGVAQISGRNLISWADKFAYDVWYVDNRSFALDLHILLKTVARVLRRDGISATGHATMAEFMGSEHSLSEAHG